MRLDAASDVLARGVADGLWPGVVAAAGVGGRTERTWVLGRADTRPERPMTVDTVFDLASLTKVLATLPVLLRLVSGAVARRVVRLDTAVSELVPGVDERVTIEHLLTHTAGLPAHVRFAATDPDALVAAAAAVPLEAEPGTRVAYSDVGFVLLGGVVHAVTGERLDAVAERDVFGPLGIAPRFRPPASWRPRIAATEVYDDVPTVGVVHDENAQLAGGLAGHAGLFGTLADVVGSLPMWRRGGPLLDDAVRAEAMRDRTAALDGHRGLGWTCRGDRYDILSAGWGDAAVSHTGFTGTSVAFDPVTERWAVLLTNHVHFGRGRPEVFAARRRWHAVLVGD
ncbi:CubicO group peptidase, beta-lactamase class C family [Jatrophihabitans endophyticus]|uniref:CubicO group peptidase, beta-lactamase class C family n=1 Tax=Jatrophihabitans endophyticus TaxID=1206085 RepID=A0A1M5P5Q1_9ACTN|nr:serine hydrolase domain-containing protein [Jatrophihabitans endophyticus]SHG97045.1 CubicO group peptidase, beta-lactamase class C family [Jatrophihabitans endophyticus]